MSFGAPRVLVGEADGRICDGEAEIFGVEETDALDAAESPRFSSEQPERIAIEQKSPTNWWPN